MKRLPIKKIFLISLGLWLVGISGCGDSQVSVSITPTKDVTVPTDQTFLFTTEVSNTQDLAVTWSIDQNGNGSLGNINADSGLYTPPSVIPTPNTAKIRVTSQADSSSNDSVTVTIVSGNTLRFGTNLQVTDYSVPIPPGSPCTPGTNCIASTVSSGQHSVEVYHAKHGKYDYTLIYTVWSDDRNGAYDVFLRQITLKTLVTNPPTAPVVTLSNTVQVNDATTDSSDPANPSLGVDNAGNVYVAWQSDRGPMGTLLGYHNIYVNKGKLAPFKNDVIPNVAFTIPLLFSDSPLPCDKRAPSIAVENNNKVYVAWEDLRATSSCSADSTIRAAGGPPPPNPPPNPPQPPKPPPISYPILPAIYLGSGSQTEPSIGFFQSDLYVAWTGNQLSCTGICFAQGKTPTSTVTSWSTTGPVLVNDDPGVADHSHPSLVVDSTGGSQNAGNVYVAWQDNRNGNYDIFFAKKEKNGTIFDAATDQNNPTEHNIRVNDDTVANGFNDTAEQIRPSIVVEHSEPNAGSHTPNKLYVVWQDQRNHNPISPPIYDIFTSKSIDGGNSFRTNSGPANLPSFPNPPENLTYDPSIAVDTYGRAYLIWTDERNNSGAPGADTDVFFTIGQ